MNATLQVMKFGGTSVGDATCIARTAQIVAKAARQNPCIVVVSAMSGVTNRLIEAARKAATADSSEGAHLTNVLRSQHAAALEALIQEPEARQAPGEVRDLVRKGVPLAPLERGAHELAQRLFVLRIDVGPARAALGFAHRLHDVVLDPDHDGLVDLHASLMIATPAPPKNSIAKSSTVHHIGKAGL